MGLKSKLVPVLIDGVGSSDQVRGTKEFIRPDPDAPIIFDDKEEKDYIKTFKDIEQVLEVKEIQDGSESFKKWSFKELAKDRITTENPRLLKCPKLLELFTEILHYRWSGKKKKHGYIQATINQISVGMQLTEEEANALSLDNDLI